MTSIAKGLTDRYQAVLPAGMTIIRDELPGSNNCGHVYSVEDARSIPERPVKRVVRFLDDPEGSANWHKPLRERAWKLIGLSLPYVSTLREIGSGQGVVYLVHDEHPQPLATKALESEGLAPRVVEQIADQLLLGLAALHGDKVFHGDLRRNNVFFSEAPNVNKFAGHVWIADSVIGGLTHWSHGEFRPALLQRYFPPEWHGQPHEPSAKDDLYSLGVLLSELLLGAKVVEEAHQSALEVKSSLWASLAPQLKSSRVGRQLHYLLSKLMADEDDRPADGAEAIKLLQRRQTKNFWGLCMLAGIAGLLIGSLALFASSSNAEVERRTDQARSEGKSAGNAEGINEGKKQSQEEIEKLKSEVARLKNDPPTNKPPIESDDSPAAARKEWQATLRPDSDFEKEQKDLEAKHEKLRKTDPDQANLFGEWLKHYRDLRIRERAGLWFGADKNVKPLFRDATREPWMVAKWEPAEQYLKDLATAAGVWQKWANNAALARADLDRLISGRGTSVEKLLRKWLDEIEGKTKWKLRLISGSSPEGYGGDRTIWVYGSKWSEPLEHGWPRETSYVYKKHEQREVEFEWELGQDIIVALKCNSSILQVGRRPYRIYDTIKGPLTIWKLNLLGMSEQDGFVLKYEVIDCPGPPRDLFQAPIDPQKLLGGK